MQDTTNPMPETAQPEVESPDVIDADVIDSDLEQPDGQATEPEIETEEVEHDGKKYSIPKALKPNLMMQADYTRKTQEVAELRKSLETERTQIRQANEEMMTARATVMAIDAQLAQYQQIDWNTLSQQDPVRAQQLFIDQSQLKDRRQQAVGMYSQLEQQQSLRTQQEFAKRAEETKTVLQRDVKDWGPELERNLVGFAKELGYQDQQIQMALATDPASVKLLHMAYQFKQTLQKATQKPQVQKIDPKPVQKVGGVAKATKSVEQMTDKEFADWRKRQIAQRR